MGDLISLLRPSKSSDHATLGMTLFLGSWGLTFVALFFAYGWIRLRMESWPPVGMPTLPIALPTANSILVLFSSVCAQWALTTLREARRDLARRAMLGAAALGIVFLALQLWSWTELWSSGLQLHRRAEGEPWSTSTAYAGCFYSLTGFHAAHVVMGLGWLGWLYVGLRRGLWSPREHAPVRFGVWFWHFVSVAWLAVYAGLYLAV